MTEELEKEAERFVSEKSDKGNFDIEQFGKAYFSESSMKQAYLAGAEPREKRISDLEKENAELKTRVENQKSFLERIRAKFNLGKLERKEIEGYLTNEQLSAAKDLLARWVDDRVYTVSEQKDLIADTEQFLEEE